MRTEEPRIETERQPRGGPSWGTVSLIALLLGIGAIVFGFDASFYSEYGGRGPDRAIRCDPQPDGSCTNEELIQRRAEREPKLMAKLNEVGGRLVWVGLAGLLGALVLALWRVSKGAGAPRLP